MMKLAFSALGMPAAGIDDLIRIAEAGGAEGLELRMAPGEAISLDHSMVRLEAVRRRVEGAGLTVLAVASYIGICSPGPDAAVVEDLQRTLELTAAVGGQGVRIFPGADIRRADTSRADPVPAAGGHADIVSGWDSTAARRLSMAAESAATLGVGLLLETHDSHPTGRDLARILSHKETPRSVQAIWDVLHPWRYGELPEDTAEALHGSLAYCQFKDARPGSGPSDFTLTLPGQGAIPLVDIAQRAESVVRDQGDDVFWASLEWEKAWHPGLDELPLALAALRSVLFPDA